MEIIRENIDELNAILKVGIVKDDYQEKVDTVLKDYKKKAKIDGFRPGKIPFGLIKKQYGKAVLVDEVNKLISESLTKYIREEELNILGEPLPNKDQKIVDFDKDSDFEMLFDIAVAPEIEVKLSKRDKLPLYDIKVDDELLNTQIDSYTRKFGSFKTVDEVSENEMLKGDIVQCGEEANLISVEDVTISLEVMKDIDIKKSFIGKKVGDKMIFNIRKAYPNDTELSSLLKIDKEKAKDIDGDFEISIKEISKFEKAEINQELFDKAFGKDVIKSEDEFEDKLKAEIKVGIDKEADYKLLLDAKAKLIKKFNPEVPSEFLKRWLKETNENKLSDEQIENEFSAFEDDLRWQLIKDKIIKENEIKVEDSEVLGSAKEFAQAQFQQYGMANLPEEHLENYAKEILKNKDESRKIYERVLEDKVIVFIKDIVKIEAKEVTVDEFKKILEKEQIAKKK
ncbi:MAG: trigger factor [Bacteroidales bacterium]|jgi:trigger factor|nr:trigger factor [Bacteroidales bacterium]